MPGVGYTVVKQPRESSTRQELATISLSQFPAPSWIHDFPITKNYAIVPETPIYFNMLVSLSHLQPPAVSLVLLHIMVGMGFAESSLVCLYCCSASNFCLITYLACYAKETLAMLPGAPYLKIIDKMTWLAKVLLKTCCCLLCRQQ